jgi:hypothetical protein
VRLKGRFDLDADRAQMGQLFALAVPGPSALVVARDQLTHVSGARRRYRWEPQPRRLRCLLAGAGEAEAASDALPLMSERLDQAIPI